MNRVTLFVVTLIGATVLGQELVTVRRPAADLSRAVSGERIAYLFDGGCAAQAESRVQTDPEPVSAAQCALSKNRTRAQVADAIDGGALERE